jgi:hypothetical protein
MNLERELQTPILLTLGGPGQLVLDLEKRVTGHVNRYLAKTVNTFKGLKNQLLSGPSGQLAALTQEGIAAGLLPEGFPRSSAQPTLAPQATPPGSPSDCGPRPLSEQVGFHWECVKGKWVQLPNVGDTVSGGTDISTCPPGWADVEGLCIPPPRGQVTSNPVDGGGDAGTGGLGDAGGIVVNPIGGGLGGGIVVNPVPCIGDCTVYVNRPAGLYYVCCPGGTLGGSVPTVAGFTAIGYNFCDNGDVEQFLPLWFGGSGATRVPCPTPSGGGSGSGGTGGLGGGGVIVSNPTLPGGSGGDGCKPCQPPPPCQPDTVYYHLFRSCKTGECYCSADAVAAKPGDTWLGRFLDPAVCQAAAAAVCAETDCKKAAGQAGCAGPLPTGDAHSGQSSLSTRDAGADAFCPTFRLDLPRACEPDTIAEANSLATGIQLATPFLDFVFSGINGLGGIGEWFGGLIQAVKMILQDVSGRVGCDVAGVSQLVLYRAMAGFCTRWLGAEFTEASRTTTQWINYLCPTKVLDLSDATTSLLHGSATYDQWHIWSSMDGYCPEAADAHLQARRTKPGVPQILELWLRGTIDDNNVNILLFEQGVINLDDRDRIKELAKLIPGAGELLRFTISGVWDSDFVAAFKLDDGFGEQRAYKAWLKSQGLDWYDPPQGDDSGLKSWGQAEWRAHWVMPGQSQAAEMLFRLRDSGGDGGGPRDPSGLVFSQENYDRLAERNRVPPGIRKQLLAVSRPIPSYRQLGDMLRFAGLERPELKEYLLDRGYNDRDAERLADMIWYKEQHRRLKEDISEARGLVADAFETGVITVQDYANWLEQLGIDQDEISRILAVEQVRHSAVLAKAIVKDAQARYLSGMLTEDEATSALAAAGLTPQAQDLYLRLWSVEKKGPRRQIEARQLLKDAGDGIVPVGQLVRRLTNLGYSDEDISIWEGELQVVLQNKLAKLLKEQEAAYEKEQKQIKDAIKQLEQAKRKAQADLAKHGSPGTLAKWFCEGLIDLSDIRARLNFLGWPGPDQDRLIADACERKGQRPPKPIPPVGSHHGQGTASQPRPKPGHTASGKKACPTAPKKKPPAGYHYIQVGGCWVLAQGAGDPPLCSIDPPGPPPPGYQWACQLDQWVALIDPNYQPPEDTQDVQDPGGLDGSVTNGSQTGTR